MSSASRTRHIWQSYIISYIYPPDNRTIVNEYDTKSRNSTFWQLLCLEELYQLCHTDNSWIVNEYHSTRNSEIWQLFLAADSHRHTERISTHLSLSGEFHVTVRPPTVRDARFGSKVGQIGPKWDKSGAFSDQISVHLARGRQTNHPCWRVTCAVASCIIK